MQIVSLGRLMCLWRGSSECILLRLRTYLVLWLCRGGIGRFYDRVSLAPQSKEVQGEIVQAPEPALQCFLLNIMWYAEDLVEVAGLTKLIVGLIDRVQKIRYNHADLYALSITYVARRTGCWLRVAGADEDCVENCLEVASNELEAMLVFPSCCQTMCGTYVG